MPCLATVLLTSQLILGYLPRYFSASAGATGRSIALEVTRYLAIPSTALKELDSILESKPSPAILQTYLDAKTRNQAEIASILVLDSTGIVLAASPRDDTLVGSDYSGQPSFAKAQTRKSIVISVPYVSPADGTVTVAVYRQAGQGYGVVSLRLEELSSFISSIRVSEEDRIAVTDSDGRCAAATDQSLVREQWTLRDTETLGTRKVGIDGRIWLVSTTHIPGPDWHVLYYRDPRDSNAILRLLMGRLALVGILTVLVAAWTARRLQRSFAQPFSALLSMVTDLSSGDYAHRVPVIRVEEFSRIADSFNAMADNIEKRDVRIKADLSEKVILLKEIHHRVKNNLQIMASLLNLGSGAIKDPADLAVFRSSQDRIHSMALVHEILYESDDFSSIDLGLYVSSLLAYLNEAWPLPDLRIKSDIRTVRLSLDKALPCGLILNELVTNCFKYALPGDPEPYLRVFLQGQDGGRLVVLEVEDHGPGLPEEGHRGRDTSLGFSLVEGLALQLGARLEWLQSRPGEARPGLLVRLSFEPMDEKTLPRRPDL